MNESNGGSRAYPTVDHTISHEYTGKTPYHYHANGGGLTKREAFTLATLQGILANPSIMETICAATAVLGRAQREQFNESKAAAARTAVGYADAALAELAKGAKE